ncbi:MAG: hypothetical protein ACRC0S_00705 [Fusobacteriaceae bacterium]
MKKEKRKKYILYKILLIIVYTLISCNDQNQVPKKSEQEKAKEEIGIKKDYEYIMSEEFKPEISEILKKRILKVYKEKFPEEEFYYLAEPRLMTEKYAYAAALDLYKESRYVAFLATPKMNGAQRYSIEAVYVKSEEELDIDTARYKEELDIDTARYEKEQDLIAVNGKVGDILEEVFGRKGSFEFSLNINSSELTEKHYRWLLTGENTFEKSEESRSEEVSFGLYSTIYINFIVDDIEKINEQEIGDKLIVFGERLKAEVNIAGGIDLSISDKKNYLPIESLYRRIGPTLLATPRVREIVKNWKKPITKDLDYIAQYMTPRDGRKYWFRYNIDSINAMQEGVRGRYTYYKENISRDIKWEKKK